MRVNLNCPFAEKDQAKALGARWDAARRVWYIENVEDLTPFMRWIPRAPSEQRSGQTGVVTLESYLSKTYGDTYASLSRRAAKAFRIPWPLRSGWAKLYAGKTITQEAMGKLSKPKSANKPKPDRHAPATTGSSAFVPLCSCDALPWVACEHTAGWLMRVNAAVARATASGYTEADVEAILDEQYGIKNPLSFA